MVWYIWYMAWYTYICSMMSISTCNTKRQRRKMPIQALAILLSKASEVSEHFQPNPQTGLQKSFPAVQLSESSSSSSQACKVSDSSSRATNASNNLGAFFVVGKLCSFACNCTNDWDSKIYLTIICIYNVVLNFQNFLLQCTMQQL